ncbi:hypothetical protein YC2023_122348 [Brassica napus]
MPVTDCLKRIYQPEATFLSNPKASPPPIFVLPYIVLRLATSYLHCIAVYRSNVLTSNTNIIYVSTNAIRSYGTDCFLTSFK